MGSWAQLAANSSKMPFWLLPLQIAVSISAILLGGRSIADDGVSPWNLLILFGGAVLLMFWLVAMIGVLHRRRRAKQK